MGLDLIAATPAARNTDPETSHLAAEENTRSGRRAVQQHAVLAAVMAQPGLTSRELAQAAGMDRYVVARRLPELEAAKIVRKGGARECRVSKRRAVTWWPA